MDVEIEDDDEEPTLRAPQETDSHNKNSNQYFNSDVDDEDEDALGENMGIKRAV